MMLHRVVLFRLTTIVVTIGFTLYSLAGCGGSDALRQLEKYEGRQYTDRGVFYTSHDQVYRAAVKGLQDEAYVITLSDPMTGLLNAEKNSRDPIPEDRKAMSEGTASPSFGAIVVGVLVVILTLGLILVLSGPSEKEKQDSVQKERTPPPPAYVATPAPTKTSSYRYIVSLTISPMGQDSTEVNITATKIFMEDGAVLNSVRMDNKYLNYVIFDEISAQLRTKPHE